MKTQNFIAFFGMFAVLLLSLSLVSAVNLATWDFEDENLTVDSGTGTLIISDLRTATFPAGNEPSPNEAMSVTGWDVADRYIELSINTSGYKDITIKFDSQASGTGPTKFKIQYSSDNGATFTDLGSTTETVLSFEENPMHTFDLSSITAINNNANTKFKIIVPESGVGSAAGGTFRIDNILIEGTEIEEQPDETSFCANGPQNDSDLNLRIDLKNKGAGEEDNEWLPLDKIEVEVEIENDGDDEIEDIVLELGLFKEGSDRNIADDMLWISEDDEEVEIGDIDEDDDEEHTFVFRVDPEIEAGDYLLKVKAYSEDDEDLLCIDYSGDFDEYGSDEKFAEIDVNREDLNDRRAVIVDVDEIDLYDVLCDQTITLIADVYNIADQDQDQFKISLKNSELGIDLEKEIREDLDEGEKQEVTFTFDIPADAENKDYTLEFRTFYDYDDDDDTYDEYSEIFTKQIKVSGNCIAEGEEPEISAKLISDAELGKELLVKVTVTNNADTEKNFVIALEGADAWAEVVSIEPKILTISQGSTQDATLTLKPTKAGTQTFDITIIYDGKQKSQPVSVTIKEQAGIFTGAFAGIGNTTLYVTAAIFGVLIIIILVLIIRIAKAPKPAEF